MSTAGKSIKAIEKAERTEEQLGEAAKTFRDAFVREYIKDFSGVRAMRRLNKQGANKTLSARASELLRECYVQQRLDEVIRQLQPTDVVTRGQVMSRMWEEANDPFNEGGVRVTAIANCARMLGMDRVKDEDKNSLPQGVILIPCMSMEDWQANAIKAQELLKQQAAAGAVHVPGA